MHPVSGVQPGAVRFSTLPGGASGPGADSPAGTPSFKDVLLQGIDQVNSMQQQADHAVESLLTGGEVNPAEVLTAVQKADLAFRMAMQIRNKLVTAWQEVQAVRV
jgi:flagellar hook-basal body complex protein FliE